MKNNANKGRKSRKDRVGFRNNKDEAQPKSQRKVEYTVPLPPEEANNTENRNYPLNVEIDAQ